MTQSSLISTRQNENNILFDGCDEQHVYSIVYIWWVARVMDSEI